MTTSICKTLIRNNTILNCPVTTQDVQIYFKIYKKNILALKGNTTRTKPDVHPTDVIKVVIMDFLGDGYLENVSQNQLEKMM